MRKNYLFILMLAIFSSVCLTSCELFQDILKDHPSEKDSSKQLIGLWKNDSLQIKYYENGVLTSTTNQSLEGYTFDVKPDNIYINTNPVGEAYLTGSWKLIKIDACTEQILLDENTENERGYNIVTLSRNRLITNRKVASSETLVLEYTFSYNK